MEPNSDNLADIQFSPPRAGLADVLAPLVGRAIDIKNPMGTWTGLTPEIGAPLSGLLWGAGIGGLYGLGRGAWRQLRGNNFPEEKPPLWKRPWALGSAAGLALGALAARNQLKEQQSIMKMSSFNETERRAIRRTLEQDPYIAHFEKERLLGLVNKAEGSQLKRLAMLAAAGGLTASAAHSILGTGYFGSTVAGLAASYVASNYFPRK